MAEITLKELLEAGCHFGHQSLRGHPKMKPFLFGVRDNVAIFDLAKTKEGLEKAAAYARQLAGQGGKIIFVGTKRQARAIIEEEAKEADMPHVSERWLGGTITNWEQIRKQIDKMKEMRDKKAKGEYEKYTKKEQLLLDREIARLEKLFAGIESLEKIPEALYIVDIKREDTAVREAMAKGVPIIAIVDSNCDPDLATCAIPANDDAVGSIKLITQVVAGAVKKGRESWEKKSKVPAKRDLALRDKPSKK